MYNVLIKGFKSPEAAEEFIRWYEGQGEQDITIWFDSQHPPVESQVCDVEKTYPIKWDRGAAIMELGQ